ncbi:MAG: lysylphosphatidylglycerol synthase transmembrane domain-containing protein [Thermoleophilaceae bacterium]
MNRRFALFQALVSVIALAAVVWWALRQDAPEIPSGGDAIVWLAAAIALYAVATVVRAERWHAILGLTRIEASRKDCYALSTVGYMGNNVLPARAGEALRVLLLDGRTGAGKRRLLGTIVAERLLDAIALVVIFVLTVYLVLEGDVVPTDEPLLIAGIGFAAVALGCVVAWAIHRRGGLRRLLEVVRPLAHAPRALVNRRGAVLLGVTFLLWMLEGGVYLAAARAIDLDISTSGALYLVALTNFVAALPAAPGSIGTFDAAVAFGAKALGAAGSVAVTYLLLLRFVLYVPITVVGLVVLVTRYGGWARLRQAARLEASSA